MTESYDYCYKCKGLIRIGLDDKHNDYAICGKCLKGNIKQQKEINWGRKQEIKEQVINFIVLMMEQHKIDIEDLR